MIVMYNSTEKKDRVGGFFFAFVGVFTNKPKCLTSMQWLRGLGKAHDAIMHVAR